MCLFWYGQFVGFYNIIKVNIACHMYVVPAPTDKDSTCYNSVVTKLLLFYVGIAHC